MRGSLGHRVVRGGVSCLGVEVKGESVSCVGGVCFWFSVGVGQVSVHGFLAGGSTVGSSGSYLLSRMGSFSVDCWGSVMVKGWSGSGVIFWEGSTEGVGGVEEIFVAAFTRFRFFFFARAIFSSLLSSKAFFWVGIRLGIRTT